MSIKESLSQFKTVSLKDLNSVSLMNRVDIKFAFSKSNLIQILSEISQFYHVLKVNDSYIQDYRSLYYDTADRQFFVEHHNERVNRHKVRFREYVNSGITFLEIKCKNNKGKTIKKRVKVTDIPQSLSSEHKAYITELIGKELVLTPQHWINFSRITFVNKLYTERLTIDLDLKFSNNSGQGGFENVIIAEIKKERSTQSSKFTYIAKKYHILPTRLSKYCMSTIDLNPSVKYNRFKKKILLINKLKKI